MEYKLVLGLEIHLHLKTAQKMFCGCDADIYGATPNTHTCPVCLGLPGALPVPNFEAVKKAQLLGLALNCKLNENSRFDRKHYFYPDLPKGYQISQYKQPLCYEGYLDLGTGQKVEIERVHLEEDTAKSFHEGGKTLIDFNKSGMPLVEIVTKPMFRSVEEAVEFSKKIQEIVRSLEIGDVDMEKGQMRLEANISLRTEEMEKNNKFPKYKVEIKNINSFRFMERAVKAEVARQTEILSAGGVVEQENRGWNEATGTTVSQRTKEEAHDYRYFPEPDIPPMVFESTYLEALKKELPELPDQIKQRLLDTYKISVNNAVLLSLIENRELLEKFKQLAKIVDPGKAANLLLNRPEYQKLSVEEISSKLTGEQDRISDVESLKTVAQTIVENNPDAVASYKKGKQTSLEFLVGQVMKETRGKADASKVREIISGLI